MRFPLDSRKVHYRQNLQAERTWRNHGAGGIDGESIEAFGDGLGLHEELRTDYYIPQPVRQQRVPKAGKPGCIRFSWTTDPKKSFKSASPDGAGDAAKAE